MSNIGQEGHRVIKVEEGVQPQNSNDLLEKSQENDNGRFCGKWSDEENIKFVTYLLMKNGVVRSKQKRKSLRLFKQMSVYLETRNSQQCRSHFQKMMKKYKTLAKIKRHLKETIGEKIFNKRSDQIVKQLTKRFEQEQKKLCDASTQTEGVLYQFPMNMPIQMMDMLPGWYFQPK